MQLRARNLQSNAMKQINIYLHTIAIVSRFANLAGVAAHADCDSLIGKSATYAIAVQICKVLAGKASMHMRKPNLQANCTQL